VTGTNILLADSKESRGPDRKYDRPRGTATDSGTITATGDGFHRT